MQQQLPHLFLSRRLNREFMPNFATFLFIKLPCCFSCSFRLPFPLCRLRRLLTFLGTKISHILRALNPLSKGACVAAAATCPLLLLLQFLHRMTNVGSNWITEKFSPFLFGKKENLATERECRDFSSLSLLLR